MAETNTTKLNLGSNDLESNDPKDTEILIPKNNDATEHQQYMDYMEQNAKKRQAAKEEDYLQFGNYFGPGEDQELADCCSSQCMGETLLPCVPGFGCGTTCCGSTWRAPPIFWSINYLALLGHLFNTGLTFILSFTNEDVVYNLKEISETWTNSTGTNDCTTGLPANSFDTQIIEGMGNNTFCISKSSTTTSTVSLFALILWFHLLSFLFQTIAMADWDWPLCCCCHKKKPKTVTPSVTEETKCCDRLSAQIMSFRCVRERYVDEVNAYGTNALRMVEYSLSATLMQVAIALVLGIESRLLIITISSLTILCMLSGLAAELLKTSYTKTAWLVHFLGWFAMISVWYIILEKFNHSVEMSKIDGGDGPPAFVNTLIIVIMIMYMAFGLLQLFQLLWITFRIVPDNKKESTTSKRFNNVIESGYNLMSLISKSFLGYFLVSHVLFAPRVIDQCMAMPVPGMWSVLGCNVTNPAAVNVTGLGVISPADGYRECKVKCEAMGVLFTVESKENRCDKIDNETWWAEKGCVVEDPEARTVTELNVSAAVGYDSCDVQCPEDNGEFVVESVDDGTIFIGTCDQVDCSGETTYTINLGVLVTGNDIATCCVAPYTP
jgi:hypothetical protein